MHVCTQCQRSYSRQENLARHVRAAHTNEARHSCKDCHKRFSRTDLLRKHEKTHSARPFQVALPHVTDATATSASPGSIPIAQTSLNARSLEMAPCNAPTIGDFGSFGTQSYDTPGMGGPGDEHGQGLFDFDLAWTFDFLEKDGESYVELPAPRCDTATVTQEVDDTNEWPNAIPHEPPSPDQHLSTHVLEEDEIDDMLQTWSDASLKALIISDDIRSTLLEIVTSNSRDLSGTSDHQSQVFPYCRSLQYFLLLYIRRVHPRFPVMHIPTFSTAKTPAIVLMAMMLVGSCHSVSHGDRFCREYLDRCRHWLAATREEDLKNLDNIDHTFALFLCTLTATWSGRQAAYCRAELDRGVLALACRNNHLLVSRVADPIVPAPTPRSSASRLSSLEVRWLRWVDAERRKRLGICIYVLDCQYAALFQRQPYISKAETTRLALPCEPRYWSAPSAQAWTMMLGPALTPPSAYHLPTLSSILLEREEPHGDMFFPPLDGFSRTFYAYVLHTHIYEWRQNVCMLNSNGLTGAILSFVPKDIGNGLKQHKQWLSNALEVWLEHYSSPAACDHLSVGHMQAGALLHHLGDLALRISFSDLYMLARRSATEDDLNIATESICNTLALDTACSILDRTFSMTELAANVRSQDEDSFCGYELVVTLFIGGLLLWTTHHLRHRQEITVALEWVTQRFGTEPHSGSPLAWGDATIVSKFQDVISVLRSIHSVGYASLLASVLENLHHEGMSGRI